MGEYKIQKSWNLVNQSCNTKHWSWCPDHFLSVSASFGTLVLSWIVQFLQWQTIKIKSILLNYNRQLMTLLFTSHRVGNRSRNIKSTRLTWCWDVVAQNTAVFMTYFEYNNVRRAGLMFMAAGLQLARCRVQWVAVRGSDRGPFHDVRWGEYDGPLVRRRRGEGSVCCDVKG